MTRDCPVYYGTRDTTSRSSGQAQSLPLSRSRCATVSWNLSRITPRSRITQVSGKILEHAWGRCNSSCVRELPLAYILECSHETAVDVRQRRDPVHMSSIIPSLLQEALTIGRRTSVTFHMTRSECAVVSMPKAHSRRGSIEKAPHDAVNNAQVTCGRYWSGAYRALLAQKTRASILVVSLRRLSLSSSLSFSCLPKSPLWTSASTARTTMSNVRSSVGDTLLSDARGGVRGRSSPGGCLDDGRRD